MNLDLDQSLHSSLLNESSPFSARLGLVKAMRAAHADEQNLTGRAWAPIIGPKWAGIRPVQACLLGMLKCVRNCCILFNNEAVSAGC